MNRKRQYLGVAAILGVFLFGGSLWTATASPQETQRPAADNTKTNQQDNPTTAPTADQQKMDSADLAITKKIRMAIHRDKSLSVYAHNVKVISQDGKVTLRGPVRSEAEKNNIGDKAIRVAGEGNVDNQITLVPSNQ